MKFFHLIFNVFFLILLGFLPIDSFSCDPPVLVGVPADTTVNCEDLPLLIPNVIAEDNFSYIITNFDTIALPDGAGVAYESSMLINSAPMGAVIVDENSFVKICAIMEHSFLADIQVSLISPNGTEVILENSHNGWGAGGVYLGEPLDFSPDNSIPGVGYEYCWSGTADETWFQYINNDGETPNNTLPSGTYGSVDSFADFIGSEINGEWTLKVFDDWGSDDGWIFGWQMFFDEDIAFTTNVVYSESIISECTLERKWTAYGGCDTISEIQLVTIDGDIESPILENAPDDVSVECDAIPSSILLSATDDCTEIVEVFSTDSITNQTCDNCYTIIRCWTATDNCGKTDTKCQSINVSDSVYPELINIPVDTLVDCGSDIIYSSTDVMAIDNCDLDVSLDLEIVFTGNDCDTIFRIWTAEDNNGHIVVDTQMITFSPDVSIFNPADELIKIFPNPVVDYLYIELKQKGYLEIYDTKGNLIQKESNSENNVKLDLAYLPSGVYFIKFTSNGITKVEKVIKI